MKSSSTKIVPGTVPSGYDRFADASQRPHLHGNQHLKAIHTRADFYGTLDDDRRTALLEGRLPASTLNAAQLTQAISLTPATSPDIAECPCRFSSSWGFFPEGSATGHVVFGDVPLMRLEVITLQPSDPQNSL